MQLSSADSDGVWNNGVGLEPKEGNVRCINTSFLPAVVFCSSLYRLHLGRVRRSQNVAIWITWDDNIRGQHYWFCRQGTNLICWVSAVSPVVFILQRVVLFSTSITEELRRIWAFLGFRSGATEVSVLLGCSTVSLGDWCPTFREIFLVSSLRKEISNGMGNFDWIFLQKFIVSKLNKGFSSVYENLFITKARYSSLSWDKCYTLYIFAFHFPLNRF